MPRALKVNSIRCPQCGCRIHVLDTQARRKMRLAAKGMCSTCASRPAEPGKKTCSRCLARAREAGKLRDRNSPIP